MQRACGDTAHQPDAVLPLRHLQARGCSGGQAADLLLAAIPPLPPHPGQELDSGAKFIGQSDVWFFNATRAGGEVPFASCCTPNGFDAACQCGRRTECAAAYA